jgi:diacylglycerol kinase family enzyme
VKRGKGKLELTEVPAGSARDKARALATMQTRFREGSGRVEKVLAHKLDTVTAHTLEEAAVHGLGTRAATHALEEATTHELDTTAA